MDVIPLEVEGCAGVSRKGPDAMSWDAAGVDPVTAGVVFVGGGGVGAVMSAGCETFRAATCCVSIIGVGVAGFMLGSVELAEEGCGFSDVVTACFCDGLMGMEVEGATKGIEVDDSDAREVVSRVGVDEG